MKALLKSLFVGAFALAMANASADPIGGSQPCGSCFGSEITLEYALVSATHYQITLTVDTSLYNGPANSWIQGVAIKPASQVLNTSTLSGTSAPGLWTFSDGGLNSGGCSGAASGYICAQTAGTGTLADGSTWTWTFDVYVSDASKWLLASLGSSVKVNYDAVGQCDNGCLTSEGITLQEGGGPPNEVPEPQTLALVGLGLFGLALARRRRVR